MLALPGLIPWAGRQNQQNRKGDQGVGNIYMSHLMRLAEGGPGTPLRPLKEACHIEV